ncbi:hypothetical protein JGU66_03320 [Myxococcaceae bacterium JPH2]|nr:hypothetical protein [Myxococcaceae bacterium JPH2]
MKTTTHTRPRILFTGAPAGHDFSALKEVGDVTVKQGKEGLEHAEVLWVDCASTRPEQYTALLRSALDAGKTVVLGRPDAAAREALTGLASLRLEEGATALLVTRDTDIATPSSYSVTALGSHSLEEPSVEHQSGGDKAAVTPPTPEARGPRLVHDADALRHDWGAMLEAHHHRARRSVGGPGLIPPTGVLYGIRTLSRSFPMTVRHDTWSATSGKSQSTEAGFTSSFYVYRENGKASADYVVIRIQEATFSTGSLMVRADNAKGFWQFELQTECTNNRSVALISNSPGTTNGPGVGAQITLPVNVKLVQDGGCVPTHWSASHGPVPRSIEGWGLINRSAVSAGRATWYYHQRDVWNPINDPPNQFSRWWAGMFDGGYGGRVKNHTALAGASFTVETVAAWRFSASTIASNPNVMFTENLAMNYAAFANPSGTGNGHHQISYYTSMISRSDSLTINLVSATDIASPCK